MVPGGVRDSCGVGLLQAPERRHGGRSGRNQAGNRGGDGIALGVYWSEGLRDRGGERGDSGHARTHLLKLARPRLHRRGAGDRHAHAPRGEDGRFARDRWRNARVLDFSAVLAAPARPPS